MRRQPTSLAARHRTLSREWHPSDNRGLTPRDVEPGSEKRVEWQCSTDQSHVWRATVKSRAKHGGKCPWCAGNFATSKTSVKAVRPDLAREWNARRNGALKATDLTPRSGKRVWWRCSKDRTHEWEATVRNRSIYGSGCPVCSGHKVSKKTSLKARFPKIAKEWNTSKNGALMATEVTAGTNRKVWWQCRHGHQWQAAVSSRTGAEKAGCPFCAGMRVTLETSLAEVDPILAAQWHPSLNGKKKPTEVLPNSGIPVWWRCWTNPRHEWEAPPDQRSRGRGCPFCTSRLVGPTNSLRAVAPELAAEWHEEKNEFTPDDVVPGSNRRAWWRCSKDPTHEWDAVVASRYRLGTGCPFCSGRTASPSTSLAALHPEVAKEWHVAKNDGVLASDVRPGSPRKRWWRCSKKHEWQAAVVQRTNGDRGCPVCAKRRISLGVHFPRIAKEWHASKNGALTPFEIGAHSDRRAWWQCPDNAGHEWRATVGYRTRADRPAGCPYCADARVKRSGKKRRNKGRVPILVR